MPLAAAVLATLISGCAATQLDAQWRNPQAESAALRGQRVMVACEAPELVLKQLCEERMAREVVAKGATPVLVEELIRTDGDPYLPAARSIGAVAVLVVQIAPADAQYSSPWSIGLGGFGFGGRGFSGGLGVSVPVGGGRTTIGYAASARITQTATARLLWTGRASSPPSSDPTAQLGELASAVVGGAQQAGLF